MNPEVPAVAPSVIWDGELTEIVTVFFGVVFFTKKMQVSEMTKCNEAEK